MNIYDIKVGLLEMPEHEQLDLIRTMRQSRRTSKKAVGVKRTKTATARTARKKAVKLDPKNMSAAQAQAILDTLKGLE